MIVAHYELKLGRIYVRMLHHDLTPVLGQLKLLVLEDFVCLCEIAFRLLILTKDFFH